MSDKTYSLDNIFNAGQNWPYMNGASLFLPQIIQRFLSDPHNQCLKNKSVSGTLTTELEDILARVTQAGGSLVRQDHERDFIFLWKDSYIEIDYVKKSKSVSISGYYLDPRVGDLLAELEKDFITKTKKNLIFTIVQTSSGLEARSMGDGHSPLIEDNYTPKVLEDMNFVIDSFKKTPPIGRIAILDGEPGTGKTHLIRSMLSQIECIFLIVPSNLIDSMDKPSFMPLLMGIRDAHEKPIIMVIEDGDACLTPRKGDNMSMISSLLNLSDGIMGSMIDIRMVISTNADIKDIDSAIDRPGRLCKRIHVGALPYDLANKRYQQLMSDDKVSLEYRKEYTIAEVYDRVHNKDSPREIVPAPKKVIGFSTPRHYDDNLVMNKKE